MTPNEADAMRNDVLTRRTRISIETFDRGCIAARDAARIMAGILDWDAEAAAREIEHYDARVEAERESQTQPDDRTADAARLGAPDVRMGGARGGAIRGGLDVGRPVIELDRLRRVD